MIFISAQPYDFYFTWQVEVQIVNFRKHNISDKMNILVWYPQENTDLTHWQNIQVKYPEVKIFYYRDRGVNLQLYIPQLRPHILSEHFRKYPELSKEVIFYHDSDIIFNFLPDFNKLLQDDINWQSDCSGYLDYNYLRRKEIEGNIPEHEAIKKLADIGRVSVRLIESYKNKTGGAQCLLKNVDSEFWEDVERQVLEIRKKFTYGQSGSINTQYFKSENAGFQSWCADMWALNMSLWNRGKQTDITSELAFSWATDSKNTFDNMPIYHNAGATAGSGLFYKGSWINTSPIGKNLQGKENSASGEYVKAINEVNNL